MRYSRSSYLSLPSQPGVYQFFDKNNTILYVGKAKDLKSRVSSYFTSKGQLGNKTQALVAQITHIETTIVESELESLLLEAFYIKKYKPKYNIRLVDGKSYLFIRITMHETYPALLLARRDDDPHSVYYGPFPSSGAVKLVLKTIRRAFPFQSVPNHAKRECLYYHLGLCPCPPVHDTPDAQKEYKKNLRNIIKILEGESKRIVKELEKERDQKSKEENYEEAHILQKRIDALHFITQPRHLPFEYDMNPNLRVDIREQELQELQTILHPYYPDIALPRRIECYDISNIQGTNATASMVVLIDGEKASSQYRKFKIRRPNTPNDFAMMQEVLSRRIKHREWDFPQLLIVDGGKGQVSSAKEVFEQNGFTVPLIGLAKREETIIVPVNPNVEYRNSKSPQMRDPAAAGQVQNSNKQNAKRFGNSNFGFRLPAGEAGVSNFIEISLPKDSKVLHLLMRIRDESHRFALGYHRTLRSKAALQD